MRVFHGKLNTNYGTENESITLVAGTGFQLGTIVVVTGQWTKSSTGEEKKNFSMVGSITKLEGTKIEIFKGEGQYYWFEGTYNRDYDGKYLKNESLTLTMKKQGVDDYGTVQMDNRVSKA